MGETLIIIQQGTPVVVEDALTFLGTGSQGDPAACRRLVWPASVSPLLPPLTYTVGSAGQCFNPSRTFNLDNKVLPHPRTSVVETLSTTKVVRFERGDDDVVVTETWDGGMTTALFRLFYDYLINASLLSAVGPSIQWEPRDRSTRTYDVALLSLTVGAGEGETRFDVADIRADQGVVGTFDNALTSLSPLPRQKMKESPKALPSLLMKWWNPSSNRRSLVVGQLLAPPLAYWPIRLDPEHPYLKEETCR